MAAVVDENNRREVERFCNERTSQMVLEILNGMHFTAYGEQSSLAAVVSLIGQGKLDDARRIIGNQMKHLGFGG